MTMNDTLLTTEDLVIGYPARGESDTIIGSDISLELKRGELVCLLGPNGAGKSTLLRTIAQMQAPLGGRITIAGEDAAKLSPMALARNLSIVLTEKVDVGQLSVYDLVSLGRHPYTDWRGNITENDDSIINWALRATGAEPLAERFVMELSDGERQKVMIARALAQQPAIILLDEPTAFLDLPHRVDIMLTLRNLARETGNAILLSTHDLDLALRSADRIWLLPGGDGIIEGAPEDLVLKGAFQETFQRENIEFDTISGSFKFQHKHGQRIGVLGSGIESLWTARALERAGYQVGYDEKTEPFHIIVSSSGDDTNWKLVEKPGSSSYTSIHDLLTALAERTLPNQYFPA